MMINLTPELAEICGIHAGDGYLRHRVTKIELEIGGDKEEKEYYDKHVLPLINAYFGLNIIGKLYVKGTYGFVTTNPNFKIFNELGFPYGKKSLIVRIPKAILESENKELFCKFLRGLFDTDGNISFKKGYGKYSLFNRTRHYYPRVNITTISKNLMKDVIFILNKLDLKYSLYDYQPKDLRDKYKYVININGPSMVNKWMELVGSKNPVKLSRYLIWKKFGFCPPNTTLQQREDILNGELDIYNMKKGSSFNG